MALVPLLAFGAPADGQTIPNVEIVATIAVAPPSPALWQKHPNLHQDVGISPAYLLPTTEAQKVTVAGGSSSFRHYFCVHKHIEELVPRRRPECQLMADRATPTSVTLTQAMVDHGGVAWHIAVSQQSIRAQWLPVPATRQVALAPASEETRTEYEAEIHPKANGLRVRHLGAWGTITVRVNGGAAMTVATGATLLVGALEPGTNTLTIDVPGIDSTTTYTATLARSLLPDAALRAAVRRALDKPRGTKLAASDLLSLRTLNLTASGITDLAGLGAAINLDWLSLDGNGLKNVADLASLRALSWLDLSNNALSNLAPLSGLTALRTLLLGGNSVTDLAPLGELTELRALVLSRNAVSDLVPLSTLTGLEELWLDDNAVSDIRALRSLPGLRDVRLGRNQIANVQPLGVHTNLTRLSLRHNAIADISSLWTLRSLAHLDLEHNRVRDVAPLRHLTGLARLRLRGNRIADVAPLTRNTGFGAGDALGLRDNPLTEESLRDHVPRLRSTGAAVLLGEFVPLFPASARDPAARQGFVRVINRSDAAGEVLVEAVDDAGVRAPPVRLSIGGGQARHFNSQDLETGNAAKGLSAGVGAPTSGEWRLAFSSTLDIEVLAYIRGPDGFLTSVHDLLTRDEGALRVPIFNPSRRGGPASSLRLVNPNGAVAAFSVWGVDDSGRGQLATGLSVPPRSAATVTAPALEAYRIGVSGRGLRPGTGRWRLEVNAPWPLAGTSLLTSNSGQLTNLSSSPARRAADGTVRLPLFPAANDGGRQGLARIVNHSAWDGVVWVTPRDDAGHCPGAVPLRLPALQTIHFHSDDLESAVAERAPSGVADCPAPASPTIGPPTNGDWHLEIQSDLDISVYAYIRTSDGFLTDMHEVAPLVDGAARLSFFNPASNQRQRSLLRLVNNGGDHAPATVRGVDDSGAPGGLVRVTVPPHGALTLSAMDLEAGGAGIDGALGDGAGKWRLTVSSTAPLEVMSLLASPGGQWSNLTTAGTPAHAQGSGGL